MLRVNGKEQVRMGYRYLDIRKERRGANIGSKKARGQEKMA
jgi:aspartyl-tRNA synthetase